MDMLDIIFSLIALVILEIVLGIDNLIFLSILTEKLPLEQRKAARRWGLTFAWVTRLCLLASAVWLAELKHPLFSIARFSFSARDLFLFAGGAFLIVKATQEIHDEVGEDPPLMIDKPSRKTTMKAVVTQVAIMDVVFSLDSVLTAIGLTNRFWVMAAAITCAILVMIYASEPVSRFIDKHPTIKMLALSFLILIGTVLIADSFSFHVPRAYVYFAMGFSISVELLNMLRRSRHKRRKIHK
ncbi:Integral membrane protein TerC [Legionella quinlivanii]|uniref:Integral membrane protein TerC n=1 Tax=Legionella quinlivanii TaxID=45073 RepID=A0A0W0XUY4_9GAMM|nr:TerC family protein [Legionella quinlivanii]KTD48003.1 Integral membrane protein TerC [Legionella quinlivanii]MCW8450715.1 TerC family protein [Legionella quinlivanii]SEG21006.1 Membrane protein TerC, possibly involved in tellurium resistance [Legionella quinlivanii DSM 21216]STY11115.1 transport proteins [Legionella quinlivanii]